ncbi:MAG: septum site-determining protein MinD, partial [Roseburia sp.]
MGEVITFTSGKGGVGKTTTTANVGVGLSLLDKKVVLVDTDIGLRNLDVVMGLENRILYNLVDVLMGRCRLKQAVIRDKRYPNLSIIPSSCSREGASKIGEAQMKSLLEDLRAEYDYILVDSPAGIDQGFRLATFDADRIMVVTTPQVAAIHGADCVL